MYRTSRSVVATQDIDLARLGPRAVHSQTVNHNPPGIRPGLRGEVGEPVILPPDRIV